MVPIILKLLDATSVMDWTRCLLAIGVIGTVCWMAIHATPISPELLVFAGAVLGSYFTSLPSPSASSGTPTVRPNGTAGGGTSGGGSNNGASTNPPAGLRSVVSGT